MKRKGRVQAATYLRPGVAKRLERVASDEGVSKAEILRRALKVYLKSWQQRPPSGADLDFHERMAAASSWLERARSQYLLAERLGADLAKLASELPATGRARETIALANGFVFFVATAIENALKAIIVRRKPHLVTPQGLSKKLTSHDLPALAKLAGLGFNRPGGKDQLVSLTNFVRWAARYPGARNATDEAEAKGTLGFEPVRALETAKELIELAERTTTEEATG